jgi:hypothetical protein
VSRLSRKCVSIDASQPYGPPRPVTGIALRFYLCLRLPSRFFPSGFPSKSYMQSYSSLACNIPCPSPSPWLDHSNYIWRRAQIMKFLNMKCSPTPCLFHPSWVKIFPSAPSSQVPSVHVLPLIPETKAKLWYSIFWFLRLMTADEKLKVYELNGNKQFNLPLFPHEPNINFLYPT